MSRPLPTLALVLWCTVAAAGPGPTAVDVGANAVAWRTLSRRLERHPDNGNLMARLATTWSHMGLMADALGEFALCPGAPDYESDGIEAHADALRAFGRGWEAAQLRLSRRVMLDDEGDEVQLLVDAMDDLLSVGRPDEAVDLGWQALSLTPESLAVHAALSEALRAAGQVEEAEFHLWLATRSPTRTWRVNTVLARRQLAEGDDRAAAETLARIDRRAGRELEVALARLELYDRQGDVTRAATLLSDRSWELGEAPGLLAWRVRVTRALGEDELGAEYEERYAALYGAPP